MRNIKVAVHQPNFLPWAGFWHKLISADLFVICTGLQYSKKSFSNRVMMADNYTWATIPVYQNGRTYDEIYIADQSSVAQIGRRISHWADGKQYIYRERLAPIIERLKSNRSELLTELNEDLIFMIADLLGEPKEKIIIDRTGWNDVRAKDKIPTLINKYGNQYLAGSSSVNYLSRKDLSLIRKVFLQNISVLCPKESVIHLIASAENPREFIINNGSWSLWEN
jgi:hypothetical protein